jgi:hypothetical protein
MLNLSLVGPVAAFMAFGRVKVCPILVLSSLIFSSLAASASCETDMAPHATMSARFVDFMELEKLSDEQIIQELAKQKAVYHQLKEEREKVSELYAAKLAKAGGHNATSADIRAAGIDTLILKGEQLSSHLAAIENFEDALKRVKERRQSGVSASKAIAPLKIEINVRGKSEREVLNEIVTKLKTLNLPLEQLVLRYFSNGRHDLTALYGIDNYGTQHGHQALWDDQGVLSGTLNELKLQRDDGFHGAPLEFFFLNHEDQSRIADGIGRISGFMNGEQAISVYDVDQLVDYDADFYVFRIPAEKVKAIRAILLPVDR